MKRKSHSAGFALAITLVLLAFILIIVVAYLSSSRIQRSTASVYANRLRAQLIAESGLSAATHLLRQNTQYGNYVTAMPSPSPSPSSIYTEIYRPLEPSPLPAGFVPDYLRLDNAVGDTLVSRVDASATVTPTEQIDPRPTPTAIPAPALNGNFGITAPTFTSTDSYDFNQIVRVGTNDTARLVGPSPTASPHPAFGQWVRVRNNKGDLIGRYAFFIEDESMKANVNSTGNNLGTGGANFRVNDMLLPTTPVPATQVQEIDPTGILPSSANRVGANTTLTGIGAAGGRLISSGQLGLLNNWQTNFSDYAYMATAVSKDDETTGRGWQRLDLNSLVASAADNAAKVEVAKRIADWIRDAWTGPTKISDLKSFQMFSDDRLRYQIAANIVDYIDSDDVPTDMGDFPNIGEPVDPSANGTPVIGIEKIPYLVEVDVTYKSAVSDKGTVGIEDSGKATITVNLRLNFQNLFERDLKLEDHIGKIRIKGIPAIDKEGKKIFDRSADWCEIPVANAAPAPAPGLLVTSPISGTVAWGGDNVASGVAGVKTFTTNSFLTDPVSYKPSDPQSKDNSVIAQFEAGLIEIEVIGKKGERLDSTRISLSSRSAKLDNSSSNPQLTHDFLENSSTASSINTHYHRYPSNAAIAFGDPRYRPDPNYVRWYTVTRTDSPRLATTLDKSEMDSRTYSVDWYDYIGNRPMAFHRNGPMLSIGELGNISAPEYPWRTLYLQYAGRPQNTTDPDAGPEVQDRRGSSIAAQSDPSLLPHDYVLVDLFRTSSDKTRSGAVNINTQFNNRNSSNQVDQGPLVSLTNSLPRGGGIPGSSYTATLNATASTLLSTTAANRRIAVAPLATGGPGTPGPTATPPIWNNPRRPYFTIGDLASDISSQINQSENSTTTGNGRSRTTINYSVLRNTPTTKSQWTRDYGSDMQVEEPFRKVSNAITTRGNVFRVLFVGQAIRDLPPKNGNVDAGEVTSEYLGEAIVERSVPNYEKKTSVNPDAMMTLHSDYRIVAQRVITE